MKIYQVVAYGKMRYFDQISRFHSIKVFIDRDRADEYIPEFMELCTVELPNSPLGIFQLENITKTKIVELELLGLDKQG